MKSLFVVVLLALPAVSAAEAPKVSHLFPAGGRRGETVDVTAAGKFASWPVEAAVDRPGLEIEAGEKEGKFSVSIDPDAEPGVYWVRFFNEDGAASPRPFVVGTLPEVVAAEPNDEIDQAQKLGSSRMVVNGRLEKSEDVDCFAVPLKAGQTLVAALEANRRLGSPMDGVLQVVSPDGFVVDHADDSPLLDPMLAFTAAADGTYIVRTFAFPAAPNSSIRFAGDADFVYRLTLTTGGYADHAHPSAVPLDSSASSPIGLIGWSLPGDVAKRVLLAVGQGEAGKAGLAWHPDVAGTAEVQVVDHPVVVEADAEPATTPLPSTLCGRIDRPEQRDLFEFEAAKGASLSFRVEARSLGSPLDPTLRVLDPSGQSLASADDARKAADPILRFEPPAAGSYRLEVRDLFGRGGPRFFYRIEAQEVTPDFALSLESDHVELKPGEPLKVTVAVDRRNGFNEPIAIEADGLPAGVTAEPVTSEPEGDSAKEVTLRIEGRAAAAWSGPIRFVGRGGDDGPEHAATVRLINGDSTDVIWMTVPRDESG